MLVTMMSSSKCVKQLDSLVLDLNLHLCVICESLLQEHEAEKVKNGCSVMTDAWLDRKRRSIMNLCTNCADGSSFVSSKEMLDVSHTSEVIFELVDKAIEDIGPDDVVQVVTDNASNNMGAKKLLLEKRPNIFWTSCATHTINLML